MNLGVEAGNIAEKRKFGRENNHFESFSWFPRDSGRIIRIPERLFIMDSHWPLHGWVRLRAWRVSPAG